MSTYGTSGSFAVNKSESWRSHDPNSLGPPPKVKRKVKAKRKGKK